MDGVDGELFLYVMGRLSVDEPRLVASELERFMISDIDHGHSAGIFFLPSVHVRVRLGCMADGMLMLPKVPEYKIWGDRDWGKERITHDCVC